MTIQFARQWGMAGVAFACVAVCWSPPAQAQVKLEYKFPEGTAIKYKTTSKTRHVLTLMGQDFESQINSTEISLRTVGKRRGDSTLPVEKKVESLHFDLSLAGGINVTFDSSDPNAKIDNPDVEFLGEAFRLAGEITFTIVLDDQNRVKAVEGAERLLEKADKLSPMARDIIRDDVEPDKLRKEFEQEVRRVPDVLARPGESWERTEEVDFGNGQTLTLQKKYAYVGTEKQGDRTLDKISSTTTRVELKQDPAANAELKLKKGAMKVESSGETIFFDREEGQMVTVTGTLRVKGENMTFSVNGMDLDGGLDITIETNTELQPAVK